MLQSPCRDAVFAMRPAANRHAPARLRVTIKRQVRDVISKNTRSNLDTSGEKPIDVEDLAEDSGDEADAPDTRWLEPGATIGDGRDLDDEDEDDDEVEENEEENVIPD
jgi:hypothetical protein